MVGTGGTLDLAGIDPVAHPAIVMDATAASLPGNPAWSDANPPRLELRWDSDPATGCFDTTTIVNCAAPTPTPIAVIAQIDELDASAPLNLVTPSECNTGQNRLPVAGDDSVSTAEDTLGQLNVLGNDSDPDGDTVEVTTWAPSAAHGTVSCAATGLCSYTPDANYAGPDSFEYSISDGHGGIDTATVTVTVTPVNDAPVAVGQSVSTAEDTAKAIMLAATDVDGDGLTYAVVSPPVHGVLSGTAPALIYTPDAGYHGPDSFTFKVNDGLVDSSAATVSITVTPVNDAPVAVGDSLSTGEDTQGQVNVLGNDSDPDGDTVEVVTRGRRRRPTGPCRARQPDRAPTRRTRTTRGPTASSTRSATATAAPTPPPSRSPSPR